MQRAERKVDKIKSSSCTGIFFIERAQQQTAVAILNGLFVMLFRHFRIARNKNTTAGIFDDDTTAGIVDVLPLLFVTRTLLY